MAFKIYGVNRLSSLRKIPTAPKKINMKMHDEGKLLGLRKPCRINCTNEMRNKEVTNLDFISGVNDGVSLVVKDVQRSPKVASDKFLPDRMVKSVRTFEKEV